MGTASDRGSELVVSGQRVELQLTSISACTLRVSLLPIAADGSVPRAANSPELAIAPPAPPMAKIRSLIAPEIVDWGGCRIRITRRSAEKGIRPWSLRSFSYCSHLIRLFSMRRYQSPIIPYPLFPLDRARRLR